MLYKFLKRSVLLLLLGATLFFFLPASIGFSYPVPDLPEGNLIANPWFRSASDPDEAGLDGWTPVYTDGVTWGISQKKDNPTPSIIVSGRCGFAEDYCGTALRWANQNDSGGIETYPGVDVYIYTVVNANPAHRRLQFFMYWVNHKLDIAEARIYGSQSSSGPWTEVWNPIIITQTVNPPKGFIPGHLGVPWYETGIMESTLGAGYPFYKVELHARYPESDTQQGDVGIKITGVYFTAQETTDPESLSTPHAAHNPTASVPGAPTAPPAVTGDPTRPQGGTSTGPAATAEAPDLAGTAAAATAAAQALTPSATATERTRPSATPTAVPPTAVPTAVPPPAESNGVLTGFVVGMLASAAVVVLFVIVRKVLQR